MSGRKKHESGGSGSGSNAKSATPVRKRVAQTYEIDDDDDDDEPKRTKVDSPAEKPSSSSGAVGPRRKASQKTYRDASSDSELEQLLRMSESSDSSDELTEIPKECEKCQKDGVLVTCLKCDLSYHPACLKVPLNTIPKAWACSSCSSKAKCMVCSKPKELIVCFLCKRFFHTSCTEGTEDAPSEENMCPACSESKSDMKVDLVLDVRNPVPSGQDKRKHIFSNFDENGKKEFYVKWKDKSHRHNTWVSEEKLSRLSASKMKNFMKKKIEGSFDDDDETFVNGVHPDWTEVDRIVTSRTSENGEMEYYVKWRQLGYDQCTWESASELETFEKEIERYKKFTKDFGKLFQAKLAQSKPPKKDSSKKPFSKFSSQPSFLKSGELFGYQLEGLNWLRFSYHERKNVILADEMGLGKTIQTVSYILSLIHEGLAKHPFLIIAPLSTITNWERELQQWCPDLNAIVMIGNLAARNVIIEYEMFVLPSGKKRVESTPTFNRTRGRLYTPKFHVLIASYESVQQEDSLLKGIEWESLIVDEAHRLKNTQSKLFVNINPFRSNHRILLTGTPLQNNLIELYNLLSFLHPEKFNSTEEFSARFSSLTESETVTELHKILAPHLLRRVKKDVIQSLPPKAEIIVPVEMTASQKNMYKAVYTRNYSALKAGGAAPKLNNILSDLQKTCNHPFLMNVNVDYESEDFARRLISESAKMVMLDRLLPKLKTHGHRVLIFSQMTSMLDLLEDYMSLRGYTYERIDGSVVGSLRQQSIDRFNSPGSNRFCFLISTRAGGLGINLATADTVIIYDSDWNPHNDLQALARAHRIGQKNKVLIYRLVTRSSVEEKVLKRAKEKLVLERLVVRKTDSSGKQGLRQDELEEILRFGAAALFSDTTDSDAANPDGETDQTVHYDEEAIEKLLDRSQAVPEEETEGQNEYLKSFKVASFVSQRVETVAEQKTKEKADQNLNSNAFWKEVLGPQCPVDELSAQSIMSMYDQSLGKGKRLRKAINYYGKIDEIVSFKADQDYDDIEAEEDDENEEENMDVFSSDSETKKKGREKAKEKLGSSNAEPNPMTIPLIETKDGEIKVVGLGKKERGLFQSNFMMFGHTSSFDRVVLSLLKKFPYLYHGQIMRYAELFVSHLLQPDSSSDTFDDGTPKDNLDVKRALCRMAMLDLIHKKVEESEQTGLFNIADMNKSGIHGKWKDAQHWTKIYDYFLLSGITRHGYGRWIQILRDPNQTIINQAATEVKLSSKSATNEVSNDKISHFIEERVAILERALYYESQLVGESRQDGDLNTAVDEQ